MDTQGEGRKTMNTDAGTHEESYEYIREVIKLSLYCASEYHRRHPEEEIDAVLMRRTVIWEITGIGDSARKVEFTDNLKNLYANEKTSSGFEEHGWKMLEPHMEMFISENQRWEKQVLAKYGDSCLRYDPPLKDRPATHCNFHITNSISPKSILTEERYTAECFIRLMEAGEKQFGYDVLRTMTWLNSAPQWLKFFPRQWQENLGEPCGDIWGNLGFWGQIITARKTFSYKRGEYIRAHLELQYKPRTSWCSFAAMREHLKVYLV
jgi:hypothetical protein